MKGARCGFPERGAIKCSSALLLLSVALTGCGGAGSAGAGGGGSQTPDFSLVVSPAAQTVTVGKQATVSLSATPVGGFSSQVNMQVSGLPAGVSVSPTSITLTPNTPQQVTFSAAANAATGTQQVTFAGSSGSLKHTAQLSLTVNGLSAPAAGRTRYMRTDATTEYFQWVNGNWSIYDASTSRIFVTDPGLNRVTVIDATTESEIASITVPGAFSVDDTPDHKTIYVGTIIGDLYTLDPIAMTVTQRYPAAQIGPYGFFAANAQVLSNGDVALLGTPGGIPSVDGTPAFGIWNPSNNSINVYATAYGADQLPRGVPYTIVCGSVLWGNIGGFSRTVDRSKVILSSVDGQGLCLVDGSTGQDITGGGLGFPDLNFRTTPDGKYIVEPTNNEALPPNNNLASVYDSQTLNLVRQFVVSGDTSTAAGFAISADSKTLFTPTDSVIYAYDLATGQQTGWLPNVFVPAISPGSAVGPINSPNLQAVGTTGLLAGPLEEGFAFVDPSIIRGGSVGTQFTSALVNPPTGTPSGGTQTQIQAPDPMGQLAGVYFGGSAATNASVSKGSVPAQDQIVSTTPSNSAGPVDVYVTTTDGGAQLLPEGFSYGPTILQVTPDRATEEGGGTGVVYGYGFGPLSGNSVPSGLQVTVGGTAAKITGYEYSLPAAPFPLEAFVYTVPSGKAGSSADVTVTTSAGSTTAHGALSYLPAIQQFPLAGAELAQGTYDSHRDVYYFTDANKIQIFSRTQGKWLSPVRISGPPGRSQRLWGLGLSPDGSKLAIADATAQVIYLVDPSNWSPVQTFSVPTMPPYNGVITNAVGVAVSDAAVVYYAAYVQGGDDFDQFFQLDTNTGVVTAYEIEGPSTPAADVYLRTELSSDNSTVFFNDDGEVDSIDTATDKISWAQVEPGCCYGDYELTLSGDQASLEANEYFYDFGLEAESYYALNDREALNIEYVYGAKLSADGELLFQPSTNGIDVLDGRLGNLLTRISLPVAPSENYDALVADGADNVLVAIMGATGDGVAVVDLSSVPDPPPLPYAKQSVSREGRAGKTGNRSGVGSETLKGPHRRANPRVSRVRAIPHVTRRVVALRK